MKRCCLFKLPGYRSIGRLKYRIVTAQFHNRASLDWHVEEAIARLVLAGAAQLGYLAPYLPFIFCQCTNNVPSFIHSEMYKRSDNIYRRGDNIYHRGESGEKEIKFKII
jgi:hypothetical protein